MTYQPDFNFPSYISSIPDIPMSNSIVENIENNNASSFYEILAKQISEFDKSLNNEEEVGVRLVNFGQTVIFTIKDMGYHNPSLIFFMVILMTATPFN